MSETTEALKAATTAESTAVATLNDLFEQFAGAGNENVGVADIQIPYLGIIQASNDEIKPKHAKFIKGAAIGMIFNNLTGELYDGDQGVIGISCFYDRFVNEWRDKKVGGGIAARHALDSDVFTKAGKNEKGKPVNVSTGNDLIDTAYHSFLQLLPSGGTRETVISMKSTQHKPSKRWNSLIKDCLEKLSSGKEINPPRFAQVYKLTTVVQSHTEGDSFNWSIQYVGPVNSLALLKRAQAYHNDAKTKGIQAAPEDAQATSTGSDTAANTSDVPF